MLLLSVVAAVAVVGVALSNHLQVEIGCFVSTCRCYRCCCCGCFAAAVAVAVAVAAVAAVVAVVAVVIRCCCCGCPCCVAPVSVPALPYTSSQSLPANTTKNR